MSISLLLALQAAGAAPAPPPAIQPIDFDLARVRPFEVGDAADQMPLNCRGADDPEIVVCGRRPSGGVFPMEEMARLFAVEPLVAEARLTGDLVGSVVAESVALNRGEVSNRMMVRLRLPF